MLLDKFIEMLINSLFQVIAFSILPLLWWFLTARKSEGFFAWIGLKKPIIKSPVRKPLFITVITFGACIFLTAIVMNQFMTDIDTATTRFDNQGLGALPQILLYSVIQTGLSEEILFRGFLGKRLIRRLGFIGGNTIQALLFGLLHGLPIGIATGNILLTVLLTIFPGTMGWVEGYINEKYASGSIIPSWVLHSIVNILSSLGMAL